MTIEWFYWNNINILLFYFRYHCPMPKIFYVQLTVGNNEFFGEGKTRQAARHNAAMKALQALQNEPLPEKSPQVWCCCTWQSLSVGPQWDDWKDKHIFTHRRNNLLTGKKTRVVLSSDLLLRLPVYCTRRVFLPGGPCLWELWFTYGVHFPGSSGFWNVYKYEI